MKSQIDWTASFLIPFCSILLCAHVSAQQIDEGPATYEEQTTDFETAFRTLETISTTISEKHIAPSTIQQQFLSATRALYTLAEQNPPADLATRFSNARPEEFRDLFSEGWKVASSSTNGEVCLQVAAMGMVRSSGIPQGRFLSAKDHRVAKSLKENQYVGIGIRLAMRDNLPIIDLPFYGGAAKNAGARPNDIILKIDGESTEGWDLRKVVDRLRGPLGTKLMISLRNLSEDVVREYEMVRNTIPLATVLGVKRNEEDGSWDLGLKGIDAKVAYCKFDSIVGSTAAEFSTLARQARQEGYEGIVLDFKSILNSDVHHVTMLADAIFDQQELGSVSSGDESREVTCRPGNVLGEMPVAVILPDSADGPLFLLLANLKNRTNTTLVGTLVQSNGLASELVELPEGLGAIENIPTARCQPQVLSAPQEQRLLYDEEVKAMGLLFGQPVLTLTGDVEASTVQELYNNVFAAKNASTITSK